MAITVEFKDLFQARELAIAAEAALRGDPYYPLPDDRAAVEDAVIRIEVAAQPYGSSPEKE